MQIRKTTLADVDAVAAIYDRARIFMREQGNPTQWAGEYPNADTVRADVANGVGYVCEQDGRVVGAFAFIVGDEPTYQVIEGGSWRSDEPYGTIHRIASDGTVRGVARACFDFCAGQISHLRIDTHADNLDTHADNRPMQGAILKFGFEQRGIIYVEDGSPRLAYDWLGEACG